MEVLVLSSRIHRGNLWIPHSNPRPRFDSVFKGYFSDDVFWKSGNRQAVNRTKTSNTIILVKCKNIGDFDQIVENNQQET